jgi:hypothetical protein
LDNGTHAPEANCLKGTKYTKSVTLGSDDEPEVCVRSGQSNQIRVALTR